jgi:hypothetical protein
MEKRFQDHKPGKKSMGSDFRLYFKCNGGITLELYVQATLNHLLELKVSPCCGTMIPQLIEIRKGKKYARKK